MNVKKILIFSMAYYPHVGGAEVAIKEITDRIGDLEFHLVTKRFSPADAKEEKIGNVFVHRISTGPGIIGKFFYQFGAAYKGWRLHSREHFDAAWAMMAHSAGVPAYLFHSLTRVPYVLNLQEGDPPAQIERTMLPLWPFFTRAFTHAAIIQPLSNFLGAWARRRGFNGPIEIIPNGVDVQYFSQEYPPAVINEVKDSLQKKMGDIFLITTSRLVSKNAVDDVIRALPLLPANVSFVVAGTGPDEAALKNLANKLKVNERVRFIGHIDRKVMPKYLQASDIFIRPSRSEGQGASFIEAMGAGLPVIATQEGGIADFLYDEKRNPGKPITGWAVDKNSPQQIAAAVHDLMAHQEKMRAVVATAKQMVIEKYDWQIIAHAMREKVFGRILPS